MNSPRSLTVSEQKLMRVHFVLHEAFEAPGAVEAWVTDRGYGATFSRVYQRDPLPSTADSIDILVVMGGPQSPSTTKDECSHFDAAAECALIRKCIEGKKVVLGVCLGAQLIGEALGAACEHSPEKEIGKFPVTLTAEGKANPMLADFGDTLEVGHWHSDMPGLTPGAKVLAESVWCPRQIVQYGDLVYGFQCHMELNPETIDLLIAASEQELAALKEHRFVQQPDVLRANSYEEMNQKLFSFLDRLADASGRLGGISTYNGRHSQ